MHDSARSNTECSAPRSSTRMIDVDCYRIVRDALTLEHAWHLIAARDIAQGTTILAIEGVECAMPTRHSVQFGPRLHITPPAGLVDGSDTLPNIEGHMDGHFGWRYLDHSCAPNCTLDGRLLIAIRPIRAGEKISFDYETTEHTISSPFKCSCGSCDGRMIVGHGARSRASSRATRA